MKTVAAADFKARCLALLDEVAEGEELLILKRGKPVARVVPLAPVAASPQATLLGTMVAADDLLEPPFPPEVWDAERGT